MKYFFVLLICSLLAPDAPAQSKVATQGGFEIIERWTTEKDFRKRRRQKALRAADGSVVIDYNVYTYIAPYAGTVFIVGRGWQKNQFILPETYGLYDAAVRREIQPSTASEFKLQEGCVGVMKDAAGNYALLDLQGKDIAPYRYADLKDRFTTRFGDGNKDAPLSRVRLAGQWLYGYVDACGRPVTPMHYRQAGRFSEGFSAAERDGKYTFIDATGREVIPPKYVYLTQFSSGIAAFTLEGKAMGTVVTNARWGFLNTKGEELVSARFEEISYHMRFDAPQGRVDAKLNGRWVRLEPLAAAANGGEPQFTPVPLVPYRDGEGKPWGYAYPAGERKLSPQWDRAEAFRGDRAIVAMVSKKEHLEFAGRKQTAYLYGLIDDNGTAVIPAKYRGLSPYTEDVFIYSEGPANPESAWLSGLIDRNGKVVVPAAYSRIYSPSEGLTVVKKDGRYGYLDAQWKFTIPPKYAYAGAFYQGRAPVSADGQHWFWIDQQDQPLLAEKNYVWVSHFVDGKASAWTKYDQAGRYDGKLTIDLKGATLVTHALNPPLPPQVVPCPQCNGTGSHFETVTHNYTVTNVDNYNAMAPGAKVITTKSGSVTEVKRVGECRHCQGSGRITR